MAKILDIKDVPKSPNTGFMSKPVYNPLNENFTHSWDGTPYTIPAGEVRDFPEFLAYHLAKHLAQKIVSKKWEFRIKKDAIGQITPDTAKAIPLIEIQTMMEALLLGKDAFEKIEASEPTSVAVPITTTKPIVEPKIEEPKVEVNPLKCECGYVAKTKAGLAAHRRFKHPTS